MKKSVRLMMLGISMILCGILGSIYALYGPRFEIEVLTLIDYYIMYIVPWIGVIIGPIIIFIAYIVSYVYDDLQK